MPPRKRTYNSPPRMGGDSTKRVRYDSDEDGVDASELDFPNRKARRGAVRDTEGYHSDSSGGEDDAPIKHNSMAQAAGGADAAGDDEDDDMFGGAATEPKTGKGKGLMDPKDNDTRVKDSGLQLQGDAAKGGKEYLELGDIEGQEFDNTGDESSALRAQREAMAERKKVHEDEIDYVEGEEHANDDDAVVPKERKSEKGMGFAMSSFNMKDEMSEGRFTADGSYQANAKDPDSVYDNWLTALTSKDIEAAQQAKERQDALFKARSQQLEATSMSRIDCLKSLVQGLGGLVKPGESVQAALARLGKARKEEQESEREKLKKEKRKAAAAARNANKDFDAPDGPSARHPATAASDANVETHDMDVEDPMAPPRPTAASIKGKGKETEADSPTKLAIDRLTTLASTLLGTHGETDIYEETHEGIIRQLIAEGEVPRGWQPKNEDILASSKPANDNATASDTPAKKSVISRPLIARPRA